ncbi:hypothetical protein VKT23_004712 [Stygiomarasmius scandens]|uniref:Uncharacterized protein n=1 Tax=Marasmiellus scandens TaxID=2682957 RepID=A0ABR1K0P0_9AGAR
MLLLSQTWPGALVLFTFLQGAYGEPVNRTIDDSRGDSATHQLPVFLPDTNGVWEDQTCSSCAIKPDKSLAFDGTWTAATYHAAIGNISVTFDFHGTAIYIFFILANDQGPGITTVTECNFTLDGTFAGHFLHQPTASLDLQYNDNAMVFSKTSLSNENHTFQISTTGVNHDVFVNFDYAMYTFEEETVTSALATISSSSSALSTSSAIATASSQSNTTSGAIAGGAIGGVALLVVLAVLFFLWSRRRKRRKLNNNEAMAENLAAQSSGNLYTSRPPASTTRLDQTLSQQFPTSVSSYPVTQYSQSQYAPTSAGTSTENGNITSGQSDFTSLYPRSYTSRDVYSTLPSGQIVIEPRRQSIITNTSSIPPALPSSAALENPFSLSVATSPTTTVVPSMTPSGGALHLLPAPNTKAELRNLRQQELERQMEMIQREMKTLQNEAAERRASIKSTRRPRTKQGDEFDEDDDTSKLKEQIRLMHQHILSLQGQLQSPWAQGLSDEPPPGYSPR